MSRYQQSLGNGRSTNVSNNYGVIDKDESISTVIRYWSLYKQVCVSNYAVICTYSWYQQSLGTGRFTNVSTITQLLTRTFTVNSLWILDQQHIFESAKITSLEVLTQTDQWPCQQLLSHLNLMARHMCGRVCRSRIGLHSHQENHSKDWLCPELIRPWTGDSIINGTAYQEIIL